MLEFLKTEWAKRPFWMQLVWLFCLYMALIYVPYDIFFTPVAEDEQVWFGVILYGWWAKATAPIHWIIYAAGAWGFYKMHRWMHPWAGVYVTQVAIAMFVWGFLYGTAVTTWVVGSVTGTLLLGLAIALWVSRHHFRPS